MELSRVACDWRETQTPGLMGFFFPCRMGPAHSQRLSRVIGKGGLWLLGKSRMLGSGPGCWSWGGWLVGNWLTSRPCSFARVVWGGAWPLEASRAGAYKCSL